MAESQALPSDVRNWTVENVQTWLLLMKEQYSLLDLNVNDFRFNGLALLRRMEKQFESINEPGHLLVIRSLLSDLTKPQTTKKKVKRTSLPAISGSDWTSSTLDHFSITFMNKTTLQDFAPELVKYGLSTRAKTLIGDCETINLVEISRNEHVKRSHQDQHLFKLLCLVQTEYHNLESVVDDLMIALLGYLGFNDNNLLVM
ncbi:unnamed protein product [Didymodactylos carnosus]|uniref:PNT domain-containing protein n=1 Tax=Didymodactylos carnosus TaxID=1234261 RepID=A0A815R9Q6_9BILA|nr:unnamed protein product [Didymodactylos carnosus]CAF1474507.1 unnamed protein product [Didymodactylos carnosus]CAF3632155.1 unnamed protein product [Didymodactylos carnosus]CAF4341132.1 unnamed protein product [Didymodactylos carnosus]